LEGFFLSTHNITIEAHTCMKCSLITFLVLILSLISDKVLVIGNILQGAEML